MRCIRLRPVCALQTVTRKRRYIYPIPSGEGPGTPGGGGGPVGRCDRPPGGAAGRGGHPPLGGAQNPTLCPGNWHPPRGGSKKAEFSPIYFGWFLPEASGLSPSVFFLVTGTPPWDPPLPPPFSGDLLRGDTPPPGGPPHPPLVPGPKFGPRPEFYTPIHLAVLLVTVCNAQTGRSLIHLFLFIIYYLLF